VGFRAFGAKQRPGRKLGADNLFKIVEGPLNDNDGVFEDQAKLFHLFWRFDSFELPTNWR